MLRTQFVIGRYNLAFFPCPQGKKIIKSALSTVLWNEADIYLICKILHGDSYFMYLPHSCPRRQNYTGNNFLLKCLVLLNLG